MGKSHDGVGRHKFRDRLALRVSPLLLRLAVGVIFLWAGLGKVSQQVEVSGPDAARLHEAGVIVGAGAPPAEAAPGQSEEARRAAAERDFADPVAVWRVHTVTLSILKASAPGRDPQTGRARPSLWPGALARDGRAAMLAWTVATVEILAGVGLLIGFLTRLWALAGVGVMCGAMWLATMVPQMHADNVVLGVIPNIPLLSMGWRDTLWQLIVLVGALCVFLSGPGAISLDGLVFRARRRRVEDEEPEDEDEDE